MRRTVVLLLTVFLVGLFIPSAFGQAVEDLTCDTGLAHPVAPGQDIVDIAGLYDTTPDHIYNLNNDILIIDIIPPGTHICVPKVACTTPDEYGDCFCAQAGANAGKKVCIVTQHCPTFKVRQDVGDTCFIEPFCGDGITQAPNRDLIHEQCDDGNRIDNDECSNHCMINGVCGNDVLEGEESCDDGNLVDDDGCSSECKLENQPISYCGNGICNINEQRGLCEEDCAAAEPRIELMEGLNRGVYALGVQYSIFLEFVNPEFAILTVKVSDEDVDWSELSNNGEPWRSPRLQEYSVWALGDGAIIRIDEIIFDDFAGGKRRAIATFSPPEAASAEILVSAAKTLAKEKELTEGSGDHVTELKKLLSTRTATKSERSKSTGEKMRGAPLPDTDEPAPEGGEFDIKRCNVAKGLFIGLITLGSGGHCLPDEIETYQLSRGESVLFQGLRVSVEHVDLGGRATLKYGDQFTDSLLPGEANTLSDGNIIVVESVTLSGVVKFHIVYELHQDAELPPEPVTFWDTQTAQVGLGATRWFCNGRQSIGPCDGGTKVSVLVLEHVPGKPKTKIVGPLSWDDDRLAVTTLLLEVDGEPSERLTFYLSADETGPGSMIKSKSQDYIRFENGAIIQVNHFLYNEVNEKNRVVNFKLRESSRNTFSTPGSAGICNILNCNNHFCAADGFYYAAVCENGNGNPGRCVQGGKLDPPQACGAGITGNVVAPLHSVPATSWDDALQEFLDIPKDLLGR